jgi:predicted nucleotidyltransferase
MVQKNSKNTELEIILNLLNKGRNHIRGISIDIGITHTTVLRKAHRLVNEGVLDRKTEGRNQTYFLKKTVKSANYIYMAENYKTNKLLNKYKDLNIILKEVAQAAKSELILLFGSYARFQAKNDSDIDIFIETRDKSMKQRLKIISNKINLKTGRFDVANDLIKEIIKNHVIIKGVEKFYEKTKFFE